MKERKVSVFVFHLGGKMKNVKTKIMAVIAVVLLLGVYYYVALPAINIHSTEFWIFLIIMIVLVAAYYIKRKGLSRYE